MFSKTCEYGLRELIFIAHQFSQNKKVSLITISKEINSPQAFTAKILQQLTKSEVIKSEKGPQGGFTIEPIKMKTIMLSEVVMVLDGDSIYTGCGLGLKQCDSNSPCPLHHKFVEVREKLRIMLEKTSLESLISDTELLWLKR